MKMKRVYCSLLAIFIVGITFSGCEKKVEKAEVHLNEVVHSIFYAPQYVAMEKGFFAEEEINITLDVGQGADKSMAALLSGNADIALLGTEASIYVFNEGKENYAVPFAQLTQTAGNFLVSRTDEKDFDWENLKGKSIIGGRAGGMPQMVLEYICAQKGLKPGSDVEILTNLQYTSTAGAFSSGISDYTVEFDPSAYMLEREGKGLVVSSLGKESGKLPYTVYVATTEYIEKNKDTLQKFTNGVKKGQKWVKEHTSEEIAHVIAPHFKDSDITALTSMVERYKSIDAWKESPEIDKSGFTLLQDIMEKSGKLSNRIEFETFVNTEFAK